MENRQINRWTTKFGTYIPAGSSKHFCSYLPKYSTIKYQKIITLEVNVYWLFHLVSEQKSIKEVEIRDGRCSSWGGGANKKVNLNLSN